MATKHFYSIFLFFLLVSCQKKAENNYFIIHGEAQGSTYSIKYIADEKKVTKTQIDSLLTVFDMSLSTYRNDSKISKINTGDTAIVVDDFFTDTFQASRQIFEETNGLFDPTIGVLVNAYGFGPSHQRKTLNQNQIDSLLLFVGFNTVKLKENKTVFKQHAETYFDFNAIAQGYSVDVLIGFLKSKGVENAVVEIGGELFALGKNTVGAKNWIIGIDDPLQSPEERSLIASVRLENLGMATSGNYRKVITDSLTGEKFVHILNPKTGKSEKGNVLSATVLAKSCMMADGYATAFMVMNAEQGKAFAQKHPELYVMLLYTDKSNKMQQFVSDNFKALLND